MTCPFCGGEFSSQEIACPYCGNGNPEGIAFQNEVREKIERNKLLRPLLMKQKAPELVQRMLTRILIIMVGINILLLAFSFGIYLWGACPKEKTIPPEGFAMEYKSALVSENYYYTSFIENIYEWIDKWDKGELPEEDQVLELLKSGYMAIARTTEEPDDVREEIRITVKAFFLGYLAMTEEEMEFLQPGEDGSYDYAAPGDEDLRETVKRITERFGEER